MSPPDPSASAGPADRSSWTDAIDEQFAGEPVFAEPWEAQVFALAVHLHDAGAFDWSEWAQALGAEIAGAGPDTAGRGYDRWLAALERLTVGRGLVGADVMERRTLAWAEAYRSTPHGHPVELRRAPGEA